MGILQKDCESNYFREFQIVIMNTTIKFIIAIAFDIFDFTIGRIPYFGTVFDIAGTYLSFKLWGKIGLIQGLEIFDITDQIDAFIPTVTLSGLIKVIFNR